MLTASTTRRHVPSDAEICSAIAAYVEVGIREGKAACFAALDLRIRTEEACDVWALHREEPHR